MEMKDRIRLVMEEQHMSQQVFADFVGLSAATLSSLFNGRTRPTLNIVEAIKKEDTCYKHRLVVDGYRRHAYRCLFRTCR